MGESKRWWRMLGLCTLSQGASGVKASLSFPHILSCPNFQAKLQSVSLCPLHSDLILTQEVKL